MEKGILAVVSGFAGAGKGTVTQKLCKDENGPIGDYRLSVSATTRNPRPGEVDGQSYFFKTREEFEQMIKNDQLLEWAEYVGNYYGTPLSYVQEQLDQGKNVILEIEVRGALQVKEKYPDAALIFLTTENAQILEGRLRGRGTETDEVIRARLNKASKEAMLIDKYDYIVVNDQVERCAAEINQIIASERRRVKHQTEFVGELQADLFAHFAAE